MNTIVPTRIPMTARQNQCIIPSVPPRGLRGNRLEATCRLLDWSNRMEPAREGHRWDKEQGVPQVFALPARASGIPDTCWSSQPCGRARIFGNARRACSHAHVFRCRTSMATQVPIGTAIMIRSRPISLKLEPDINPSMSVHSAKRPNAQMFKRSTTRRRRRSRHGASSGPLDGSGAVSESRQAVPHSGQVPLSLPVRS